LIDCLKYQVKKNENSKAKEIKYFYFHRQIKFKSQIMSLAPQ